MTSRPRPRSRPIPPNLRTRFATPSTRKQQGLDIPLTKDQIKVQRHGTQGTGSLTISAPYTVHLDLPGYPVDLHFDASTENKSPF